MKENSVKDAVQGLSRDEPAEPAPDLLFIHDLVLDCNIGVHADEKGQPQRVRFNIDLTVEPISGAARGDDHAQVVCYDAILDVVHHVSAGQHVNLVETMAERIAAGCLALRGALHARVRVEKLDRIQGAALGVEISRGRARAAADGNIVRLNAATAAE